MDAQLLDLRRLDSGAECRLAAGFDYLLLPQHGRLLLQHAGGRRSLGADAVALLRPVEPLRLSADRQAHGWLAQLPTTASGLPLAAGIIEDVDLAVALRGWLQGGSPCLPQSLPQLQRWAAACPGRSAAQKLARLRPLLRARAELQLNDARPGLIEHAAELAALSRFHFSRVFRQVFGLSPVEFNRREQLAAALTDAAQRQRPLWFAAHSAGFSRSSSLARACRRHYGVTPKAWNIGCGN